MLALNSDRPPLRCAVMTLSGARTSFIDIYYKSLVVKEGLRCPK